jgi:hypothetical protein
MPLFISSSGFGHGRIRFNNFYFNGQMGKLFDDGFNHYGSVVAPVSHVLTAMKFTLAKTR